MQQELLDHLKKITEEEQKILDGSAEVDKELYTSGRDFIVDSRKMLDEGKLITVRTHTRFVHFPAAWIPPSVCFTIICKSVPHCNSQISGQE